MLEITLFYIAATIALVATVLAMTRANAIHALIYLIVSLLAVAVIFFLIGAPFAAALEIVIYAGAIMVLFVFVIMMLNGLFWTMIPMLSFLSTSYDMEVSNHYSGGKLSSIHLIMVLISMMGVLYYCMSKVLLKSFYGKENMEPKIADRH